jgi:uncharacterized membrane protein
MNKNKIGSEGRSGKMPGTSADVLPASRGMTAKLLTAILIVSMAASTGLALYIILVPAHHDHFTEFYILGPGGEADNYPAIFDPGEQKPVLVGIANHENAYMTYDLVVALNDSNALTTLYEEKIGLADSKTWEKTVHLKPDRAGSRMRLEFLLYTDDNRSMPYRDLYLLVNVTG